MIPKDWKYIDGYPEAWISWSGCAGQCMCPNCNYAEGFNEPISGFVDQFSLLKCDTCGTEFIGLTFNSKYPKYTSKTLTISVVLSKCSSIWKKFNLTAPEVCVITILSIELIGIFTWCIYILL